MLSSKAFKIVPQSVNSPKEWSYLEMKEIDRLLRCPICFDFMHTAMIIPECSHTFCSFCIRQHLSHTNQCPVCNHGACENNLRNNRLVDDLIVQFKSVRSLLLEATHKKTSGKEDISQQMNKTVLQEAKSQNDFSAFKEKSLAVKDDVIDLISEDGEENEDPKSSGNKENDLGVDLGLHTPREKSTVMVSGREGESSTPVNQRSSLQGMFSPSPKQMVPCPVCRLTLRESAMNDHLDVCLGGSEKKSALRKQTPRRKPMAKLVYNLMSERDIKKKLKELGLSTAGDKKTLIRRHHDFVMLYNSECDSLKPRSVPDIVKEVEKMEEIRHRNRNDNNRLLIEKNSSPATIEKAQKIYMKKHKSHFSNLIAETKKRMREQKMKKGESSEGKERSKESETETSVTETSETGTDWMISESEGEERRRMSSRGRRRVEIGAESSVTEASDPETDWTVSESEGEERRRMSSRGKRRMGIGTESSVTEASDTGAEGTLSESEWEERKKSSKNKRETEEEMGRGDGKSNSEDKARDFTEVSSQSGTEAEKRQGSRRIRGKAMVLIDDDVEMESSNADADDVEIVSVPSDSDAERRKSKRVQRNFSIAKSKPDRCDGNVVDSGKDDRTESRRVKEKASKGAKKAKRDAIETSQAFSHTETDETSRRRSTRNQNKPESNKFVDIESHSEQEQSNARSTRSRKSSVIEKAGDNSKGKTLGGTGNVDYQEDKPTSQRTRNSMNKFQSGVDSGKTKKTSEGVQIKDTSEEKEEEDPKCQGQNEDFLGEKSYSLAQTENMDTSPVLQKKNHSGKNKLNKIETVSQKERKSNSGQRIKTKLEVVDTQKESSEDGDDLSSSEKENEEKESVKDDDSQKNSISQSEHSNTNSQSQKSSFKDDVVSGDSNDVIIQTTPNRKSESGPFNGKDDEGKRMENQEKDDSLQVDETPVKNCDVESFSTLWPALSGEVDVPGDRTRHLSSVSIKSDRSNCSDLSTVFSPIKNLQDVKEEESSEKLPVRREILGKFENKKRKRISESTSRKRRRR